MSQKLSTAITVIGIDIGKNSFHVVGHDERGGIVLRQKWSRGQAPFIQSLTGKISLKLVQFPQCRPINGFRGEILCIFRAGIQVNILRRFYLGFISSSSLCRFT
jgi:hypothetical protein